MFWGKPGSAPPRFTNLKPGRLEAGAPPRGSRALYFGRTEPALPPPRPAIPEDAAKRSSSRALRLGQAESVIPEASTLHTCLARTPTVRHNPCPPTGVVSNRSPNPAIIDRPFPIASRTEGSDSDAS